MGHQPFCTLGASFALFRFLGLETAAVKSRKAIKYPRVLVLCTSMGTVLLVSCMPSVPPSSSAQPFGTLAATDVSPVAVSATPAATASSTAIGNIREIEPLIAASQIIVDSWSPDGKFLAYRSDDNSAALQTPDTLHLINIETGLHCSIRPVAFPSIYENGKYAVWMENDNILSVYHGIVNLREPCEDSAKDITSLFPARIGYVASVSPDHTSFLLTTDQGYLLYQPESSIVRQVERNVGGFITSYSWSPDDKWLAMSGLESANNFQSAKTWVVELSAGSVISQTSWNADEIEGNLSAPIWLTADTILIDSTVGKGPLLLTLGGNTAEIGPTLFGLDRDGACLPVCKGQFVAYGTRGDSNRQYHVVLATISNAAGPPRSWLYHSENGLVEELDWNAQLPFSPDGRWLILYRNPDSSKANYELAVRPVDSNENTLASISAPTYPFPFVWSPDSSKVSLQNGDQIAIYDSKLNLILKLGAQGYVLSVALWSPNGQTLAILGYSPATQQQGLFVASVPDHGSK